MMAKLTASLPTTPSFSNYVVSPAIRVLQAWLKSTEQACTNDVKSRDELGAKRRTKGKARYVDGTAKWGYLACSLRAMSLQ